VRGEFAVLDILEKDKLVENSAEVERIFTRTPNVSRATHDRRGSRKGLLMVLELVRARHDGSGSRPRLTLMRSSRAIGLKNGLAFYMSLYGPRRPGALKRGMPISSPRRYA